MADEYIDQFETRVYGSYCREQMEDVCLGRIPPLDDMVRYAIAEQKKADDEMTNVLARQPTAPPALTEAEAVTVARDAITRFASYIGSLKGRPLDPKRFFRGVAPSAVARLRLTKLSGMVKHLADELATAGDANRDAAWMAELNEARSELSALERAHRSAKVERVVLSPEVAAARDRWLVVYNANKSLIRGFLGHLGKPDLLPLIFDDLAEVQRAPGVTPDKAPPATTPAPAPDTAPAAAAPAAATPGATPAAAPAAAAEGSKEAGGGK